MPPKRPRGLKKSAVEKFQKKEGDELGEINALLESAIEKLETDPSGALPLLRGTIHSSDQLLRELKIQQDEDFEAFLDASEERLEEAKEKETTELLLNKIELVLCKVWFSKAGIQLTEEEEEVPELAELALKKIRQAKMDTKEMLEWADIVLHHGALYSDIETRKKFISWAEETLKKVLKDEPSHPQALTGLGLCRLQIAHYWLDKAADEEEEEEEEEEKTELNKEEKEAYKIILESKEYLELARKEYIKQDALMPQILADLGEIYLNEANLVLDQEKQNEIYAKTVDVIKEAQKIIQEKNLEYELPEILIEFVQEQ
ncbi:unnamed protein product [Rhizopus stolonifer]